MTYDVRVGDAGMKIFQPGSCSPYDTVGSGVGGLVQAVAGIDTRCDFAVY